MVAVIVILGFLCLVAGYLIHRNAPDNNRASWILSRVLMGVGIVALGYVFCGLTSTAVLYTLGFLN